MAHGVQGETNSTQTGASGVWGAAGGSTGTIIGVYGQTESTSGYGIFSAGPSGATGYKSAIVPVSSGAVELYVTEAAEIYFEDIGFVELKDGYTRVNLDSLWLETVTIDEQHPMHVFVQPYDNLELDDLIIKRGQGYFEIMEKNNGQHNALLSWQVMAKRKGYEDRRMQSVDPKLLEKQPLHLDQYPPSLPTNDE